MTIGEKIKLFRKQNNITQEQLAVSLNISCQAISKWENNTSFPDISLIIPIANFFGVSIDNLFDFNNSIKIEDIEKTEKKIIKLFKDGKMDEVINLRRDMVKKYPRDYFCLTNLAQALFFKTTKYRDKDKLSDDEIKEYLDEAIVLFNKVLDEDINVNNRAIAIEDLVLIYTSDSLLKNEEKAIEIANKAMPFYISRELLLDRIYTGIKGKKQKHNNNIQLMNKISTNILNDDYESIEEEIFALEKLLELWNVFIYDNNYSIYRTNIIMIHLNLSYCYADKKDKEKTLYHIKEAFNQSDLYNLYEEQPKYTSIFIREADVITSLNNKYFLSSSYIKNKLNDKEFDFLRTDKTFKAIICN